VKTYLVFEQRDGILYYLQKVTAVDAYAALRIAKQKGYYAPVIGECHE